MAVKKYIKFDTELGYLDDKDDINYFATSQMRRVAFGKMLGDFDENGLYVINKKIVDELIRMPKVIVEMVEGTDLIRSKVKADAFFHFILTVEDNKASFKLLEKLQYQSNRDFNAGAYSNINEYVLDEVIVPDKDFDRNALYEKYNISTENDGESLSIFDMDELSIALYYNIVEKIKINYLVQNELMLKEKDVESIEADYFEAVLNLLAEFECFGDRVVNAVQDDLAEKQNYVIINKPFFQKTINEILDSYIDQFMQDLSPEQRENFLNKIRQIKAEYYQKFKKVLPMEIATKAGVKFDPNQIIEESLIGTLTKEITTKGYTSSDVRKIIINEDELQLSIAKIKELVKENEEACKRDNAKAVDIIGGRKSTTEFYKSLAAKKKVEILNPDTSLIKAVIEDKSIDKVDIAVVTAKATTASPKKVTAKASAKKTVTKKTATKKPVTKKKTVANVSGQEQTTKTKPKEKVYLSTYKDENVKAENVRKPRRAIADLMEDNSSVARRASAKNRVAQRDALRANNELTKQ